MIMKKINLFFFIITFMLGATNSSFAIQPNVFVQSTVNRASDILGKNLTKEEKIEKLKIIAEETVDIKGIGNYSLGKHRKNISTEQKVKYFEIFEKYFLKTFASRLAEYSNPKISVDSEKKLNEKYTMVYSTLVATDDKPEIKINWRVNTKNPENLLIIDVVIEGVSLAKVQKEEFSSIIQSNDGDINSLFKSLKDFIDK